MDWMTGAKLAISALSGTNVKTSAAMNFAGSGAGSFYGENNLDAGGVIDLTKPSNFFIGAALAFGLGILIKKGFK